MLFGLSLGMISSRADAAPVFEVFRLSSSQGNPGEVAFDGKRPLLTVRSVEDVKVDYEHSTITVALKEADRKSFAALTSQFTGRLLLLRGGDSAMEVMHITGEIGDGHLSFRRSEEAPIFAYLMRRFHLAPEL